MVICYVHISLQSMVAGDASYVLTEIAMIKTALI